MLVYPTTDFTSGGHRYVGTMSNGVRDSAIALADQFVNVDIPALNSGYMAPELTVRVVPRAPELSPDGYVHLWPDRDDTAPDRDPAFDSVIVIWNARVVDESSGLEVNLNGPGGLAPGIGINQTYSTFPLSSLSGGEHQCLQARVGPFDSLLPPRPRRLSDSCGR